MEKIICMLSCGFILSTYAGIAVLVNQNINLFERNNDLMRFNRDLSKSNEELEKEARELRWHNDRLKITTQREWDASRPYFTRNRSKSE